MNNPEISIIIPAYNEALRIEATLQAIPPQYEIIVVDDASKDDTIRVVEKFPHVILLKNEVNRGKGYSVKRGMLAAQGNHRLFMDADHSVKIDNLPRFMEEMQKGADIVIGSIELPGAGIQDDNSGYRRVLGRWAKQLIRRVAVPGIYDTQRGFKLFNRKAVDMLFPSLKTERWGFDIEILTRAQKNGLKIKELAVDWNNSKASSVNIWSYFHTLYELICIKIRG